MTSISTKTKVAISRFFPVPNSWVPFASDPPPIQSAATGMRVDPMISSTVPVTSGGKSRNKLENSGAKMIMNRPDAMTDP